MDSGCCAALKQALIDMIPVLSRLADALAQLLPPAPPAPPPIASVRTPGK